MIFNFKLKLLAKYSLHLLVNTVNNLFDLLIIPYPNFKIFYVIIFINN